MCGWVGLSHVVHWLYQPSAHELPPDAVYGCPGEPGILRRSHPLGQNLSAILEAANDWLRPVKESWPNDLPAFWMTILAIKVDVENSLGGLGSAALLHYLRKEGSHAEKIVAPPVFER